MLKQYFVNQGIKEVELENFIRDSFPDGDYSQILLQRTPLGIKVVIYTNKPGRIIGRGGSNIDMIGNALKHRFNLENPQIDIKSVDNPDLDSKLVAKQIASALERGYSYKKIGNVFLKRIMDAGAVGCQIVVSGKLGGAMSRTAKYLAGYIKHSGFQSVELVDTGFFEALPKLGKIGITVKIMKEFRDITGEKRDIKYLKRSKVDLEEEVVEEAKLEEIIGEADSKKPEAEKQEAEKSAKKKVAKPKEKKEAVAEKA